MKPKQIIALIGLVVMSAGLGSAFTLQLLARSSPQPHPLRSDREVAYEALQVAGDGEQPSVRTRVAVADGDILEQYQAAFRRVADEVIPVVVEVQVVNIVRRQLPSFPSPFEFFFGEPRRPEEREYRRPGLGSGVLVRRQGDEVFVLTNHHVVEGAEEIEITLADDRSFDAQLVGTDERRDLAVVSFVTTEEVPLARMGDSDQLYVGDWAFAVGNPLGFQSTFTAGVISAIGRNPGPQSGMPALTEYIQTDAAINRGNSGGPLVNLRGEVIGINTWIASQTGGSIGLGFAIPINAAKRTIDGLITEGRVSYGWLGITTGDPGDAVRNALRLSSEQGAFVHNVFRGSPAEEAGLLPGDFILSINGTGVAGSNDLVRRVAELRPEQEYRFEIVRDGGEMTLPVRTGIRAEEAELARQSQNLWPGLAVTPITDEVRENLNLDRNAGNVIVGSVVTGSPAYAAGIRSGDIIQRVNNHNVSDLRQFYRLINDRSQDQVVFRIRRGEQTLVLGLVYNDQ